MRATPAATQSRGLACMPRPASVAPDRPPGEGRCRGANPSTPRIPNNTCATPCCPFPATPAIATISPACNASSTCGDRSSHTTPPTRVAPRRAAGTSRPTINSASRALSASGVARVATSRPPRSTATRSETRSTSSSLWLMKITDSPCATSWRSVAKSDCASAGVSTAVGSSRIRMRAPGWPRSPRRCPDTSAFRISTRWRSPTDSAPTRASGSTCSPKRRPVSASRARAAPRRENGRHSGSLPSITLSSTDRLSASVKCWCTMPMPAARAALGLPGASGTPNTSIVPSSAR